jgi:septum formation protein
MDKGEEAGRPKLVLASASPRRLDLLNQIAILPDDIRPPEIDETILPGELPKALAARLCREKAEAVTLEPDEIALAADTVVAIGRRILGKPADEAEARRFLCMLSGRRHKVHTGVAVRGAGVLRIRVVQSVVRFSRLSPQILTAYLRTGEWQGKAGGYAIQGRAAAFIPAISGSYGNVVGLPLVEARTLLASVGYRAE